MKAFLALLSDGKGSLQSAIVVALAGILLLLAPMLMAADIEGVRLWRAPDHTRLVLDLSDNVSFKYFTLTNPERVVIDIEQSSLSASLSVLDFGNSPIKKVRAAARNGNDLRLVLDLSARVRPNAFLLNASAQYSDRLVIDLYDSVSKKAVIKTAPKNNGRRDIIIAIDAVIIVHGVLM